MQSANAPFFHGEGESSANSAQEAEIRSKVTNSGLANRDAALISYLRARSACYLQKRVIFRNTPGPARPAAYYGVCVTRRRFFRESENFILTQVLPSNLPISSRKRVLMQKVRYPLSQCVVFLVNIRDSVVFSKNWTIFLKIRRNPGNFTDKNDTL